MHGRILIVAALLLALSAGAAGQDPPPSKIIKREVPIKSSLGRMGIGMPEQTSKGTSDGTWLYISRDIRLARWMTEDQG